VGKGSFGQVFQVRKKDTKQVFALKVLDKSHLSKIDQVQNTKQERRVLEIVNHPFIVKLHYAFQTGPALCLVMDFINGGELFMHLRKHRFFSEPDARIWAAEILLALEYLHSMGIIYRDVKPENVLLDHEGHIKLTDFGLARDAKDVSTAKEVAGSPYYMAPEVLLMHGHDVQADWWSLGILIYEMIVGLPPFYSKDTKAAYQRLLTEPLEFKPHVSQPARDLIRALLNTDPSKRLGAVPKDHVVSEAWSDGMPIKMHAWFKALRWDAVLLRQVKPSLVPALKDAMDVSNFDHVFTSDKTWKHSSLLRGSTNEEGEYGDDPFADFHYVSRPSMDKKMLDRFAGPGSQAAVRPAGRAPARRYEVMEKGRESLDLQMSRSAEFKRERPKSLDMRTSIDSNRKSEDTVGNPCSPWHPCENGHTDRDKSRPSRRVSAETQRFSGEAGLGRHSGEVGGGAGFEDADDVAVGEHSSDDEEDVNGVAHHSSHMSKHKKRSYQCNIPVAKEVAILDSRK